MHGANLLINADLIFQKANLRENCKLADLGCGMRGHFVFPAARLVGKGGIVYAVDVLKDVLESVSRQARLENLSQIKTVWTDLEVFNGAKIKSASLDVAFLINTLYQSAKKKEILREACRLLRKDGHLLIVDWKNIFAPMGPAPERRLNPKNLKIVLEKSGLRLEEEFSAGKYHFGMIFRKA